jgi:hypothetical protein
MQSTEPVELHVFDLDDTLYRSPRPPTPDPTWWYHAHSFGTPGLPGFDGRWILPTLMTARSVSCRAGVVTAVLTSRVDHTAMRHAVVDLLTKTAVPWDFIRLRPPYPFEPGPVYKASSVAAWLEQIPSIKLVTMHDDQEAMLMAVEHSVRRTGRSFHGILVR